MPSTRCRHRCPYSLTEKRVPRNLVLFCDAIKKYFIIVLRIRICIRNVKVVDSSNQILFVTTRRTCRFTISDLRIKIRILVICYLIDTTENYSHLGIYRMWNVCRCITEQWRLARWRTASPKITECIGCSRENCSPSPFLRYYSKYEKRV